ncbi:MAG TPA: cytochrome c maturation protein CcmE [Longimicrobiales bacterium]|nr:cytochrome c maturation protein CcmE [Longimicrobiales bacterium]
MKKSSRRIGMALGLIVVLSSFGYLIYGGIGENLVYFLTPGELMAKGSEAYDQPVRLGGQVMPGSHSWDADALDLRFTLQDERGSVRVHARKAPPAMFREGQGVIVEGKLTRAGVFEASSVMVKHSNEYRPPEDGHPKPAEMYKSLIRESN